ncbi:MAG TPA: type IV pilus modification protein PilV [Luteimonas sp.]|nr:type IV pilus modification protein PilV [Luteimonas sp.]
MSTKLPANTRCRRHQRGVGLIEVLIAVLVLAIGLLGIAALQATTLRAGQSSFERSQAVIQTYTILDRMRANVAQARIGAYDIPKTCDVPDAGGLVATDLHDWIKGLKDNLGQEGSCGAIACTGINCNITVWWDDSRAGGKTDEPVITSTRL